MFSSIRNNVQIEVREVETGEEADSPFVHEDTQRSFDAFQRTAFTRGRNSFFKIIIKSDYSEQLRISCDCRVAHVTLLDTRDTSLQFSSTVYSD